MQPEQVLITGATGFLGRRLIEVFRSRGYSVVGSARRPDATIRTSTWVSGDLNDTKVAEAAVAGCSVVINAAGRVDTGRMRPEELEQMAQFNSEEPACLAWLAGRAGVKLFLHISSTGVYGARAQGLCDESTPCRPNSLYERSKHTAEIALGALCSDTMKVVTVRPSNVFGEMHPWNKLLAWMRAVKSGRAVLGTDPSRVFVNYVYVEDVAAAIVALVESRTLTGGEVLNINDAQTMTEFFRATAKAVGVDGRARVLPANSLLLAGTLCDVVSHVFCRSLPFTRAKAREMTGRTIFAANRLKEICPDFPMLGVEHGLGCLARYYLDSGLL